MTASLPRRRLVRLTVMARSHDQFEGRSLADSLLDLYRRSGISGATVMQGVKGYGLRGAAKLDVLGLSMNLPVVIETVGEPGQVEAILGRVKEMVGANGLITLEDVDAL